MAFDGGLVTKLVTSRLMGDKEYSRSFSGELNGCRVEGKLVLREAEFKHTCGRSALITKYGDQEIEQPVILYLLNEEGVARII